VIAFIFALILLALAFGWIYCIYRVLCRFFRVFVTADEVPMLMQKRARLWGATGAVILSTLPLLIFENGSSNGDAALGVIVFPFIEEIAKGLAPLAALFMLSNPSGRKLFLIGALSGAGFYLTETCIATLAAALQGGAEFGLQLTVRAVALCFLHPLSTGITGLGLGLAASTDWKILKLAFATLGFSAGTFVHMWNNQVAVMVDNGSRIDQSEFFGIHLFTIICLLIAARLRIFFRDTSKDSEVTLEEVASPVPSSS
jgi:RsiW-degrading membrane proteinase PrsW (M82 family)